MLARRSLSRMYLPLSRSRRSLAIAVICLSLIALLDPLITSRPARADMRRQVRADLHRVHRVSKVLVRIRKLAEGLRTEERALKAAIDWSQSSVRGVESDSMVRLWMRMASLRYRMWVVRRAAARLRKVRHELEDRIHLVAPSPGHRHLQRPGNPCTGAVPWLGAGGNQPCGGARSQGFRCTGVRLQRAPPHLWSSRPRRGGHDHRLHREHGRCPRHQCARSFRMASLQWPGRRCLSILERSMRTPRPRPVSG